jgi:hypothetical protein
VAGRARAKRAADNQLRSAADGGISQARQGIAGNFPGSIGVTGHLLGISEGNFPPRPDSMVGRQRRRPSEQGRRPGQRAPLPGAAGGIRQVGRQALVGFSGGGTVPQLARRITVPAASPCQPVMCAPPVGIARPVVDGCPDERMPE